MSKLARRPGREDVRAWSEYEGRHALDGYLEDVMALHAQGVDPAEDRSARLFVKDGKLTVISTRRETIEEIRRAMQSGLNVVGKLAKRPDQDALEELLRDSPYGLPSPRHPVRALPPPRDDDDPESVPPRPASAGAAPPCRRAGRRS